jgi:hypothetical protein
MSTLDLTGYKIVHYTSTVLSSTEIRLLCVHLYHQLSCIISILIHEAGPEATQSLNHGSRIPIEATKSLNECDGR